MKLLILMAMITMMNTSTEAKTREVTLRWVHTSDVHGSTFCTDYLTGRHTQGGLAAIYSYVCNQRRQWGDGLIVTDGGDCLQGQPTSYYYNYVDTVSTHLIAACMNEMGYVAGALGNHDVETGHAVYDRWIRQCNFPMLGANVIDTRTGKPYLQPYVTLQRRGIKIAILGMLTPCVPCWLPENLWSGMRFDEMVESCRHWVQVIQEHEHPDLLIGLFHSGWEGGITSPDGYAENATRMVAEQVPGFDLIAYGHDHHPQVNTVTNVRGGQVVCMGPASQATRISEADIHLTVKNGRVVSKRIEARTPTITGASDREAQLFEAQFMDERHTIEEWIERPLGHLGITMDGRDAYFGSCSMIDLIHSLQLDLSGADISFAAPLSFDPIIEAGDLTVRDMFKLYKYENFLYTMRMSGREVKDYMEYSYSLWCNQMHTPDDHCLLLDSILDNGRRQGLKNLCYNMDSAAGILYTVDVTKPMGQRIHILSMADGTPFDMQRDYRVAINSYRGNGGGELLTRGASIRHDEIPGRILWSTDKDLRYYMMQMVSKAGTITPKALNQWRFIPEEWTIPALQRDRKILFSK